MRVSQYRELYAVVRNMAVSFHACVDLKERQTWERLARFQLREGMDAVCVRATTEDQSRMKTAVAEVHQLIQSVEAERRNRRIDGSTTTTVNKSPAAGSSLAGRYNRSPSRAVRLRRAARSAMRRGYF